MTRTIMSGVGVLAALGMAVGASAQGADPSLTIEGTSTIRSWTCEAGSYEVVPTPTGGFEAAVLRGEPALETVTVSFPVAAIECGNGTMNDHLRDALQVKRHPQIDYRLSRYDIEAAGSGATVEAGGELVIAGTTRPITTTVTVTRDESGALRVRGEQKVKMTDFGVRPPKLMLGTLKVGDEVTVKFDVPLRSGSVDVAAANN